MKLESIALHHGYVSEPTTRAAAVPIYQTTSYTFDDTQHGADLFDLKVPGNIYTRIMNPTTAVLEARLAEMEGGIAGLGLASGMAAITYAIQTIAGAGDNIVSISQLYGGTYNLFKHAFPRQGIEVRLIDAEDFAALDAAIDQRTKAVFLESIGNPAANIVDICRQYRRHRACCRDRAPSRRTGDGRQHGCDAVSMPANRLRRGHRHPLAHEVHRRAWNDDRRHDHRQRALRLDGRQGTVLHPERT
jgi:cystathionine beta-lyase/cystathionine gamma-synthase